MKRNPIKNIGTIFRTAPPRQERLKKLHEDTVRLLDAVEFINSKGWQTISQRYVAFINDLKHEMAGYAIKAKQNHEEIQRCSDLIQAAGQLLQVTEAIILEHNEKTRQQQQLHEG